MKTRILILIVISVISFSLAASFDDYEPSPRARAMGGAFYSIGGPQYFLGTLSHAFRTTFMANNSVSLGYAINDLSALKHQSRYTNGLAFFDLVATAAAGSHFDHAWAAADGHNAASYRRGPYAADG